MSSELPKEPLVVAILVFDEVEVLDFTGPYEVFNVTAELQEQETGGPPPFVVYTVAESLTPIKTRGQLRVQPNYSLETLPRQPDILIVPGGNGTRALLGKLNIITWIQEQSQRVRILASVCTGSLLLAKAGLLTGLSVTTHHTAIDSLRTLVSPYTQIVAQRYIDQGKIITSGGISAGIDMSLYIVRKLLGEEVLRSTTQEMEYVWTPNLSSPWQEAVLREK